MGWTDHADLHSKAAKKGWARRKGLKTYKPGSIKQSFGGSRSHTVEKGRQEQTRAEYERFLGQKRKAVAEAKEEAQKREKRESRRRELDAIDRQIEAKTHEKRRAEEAWEEAKSRHRPMQLYTGVPSRNDTRIKNKLNKSADQRLLALQDALEQKQRELAALHRKRREVTYV